MLRDERIDCAKGLAILLMIFGHAHIPDLPHRIIYSFHMPLFVLLSGYFFKPKPIVQCVKSGAKRLMLPYLEVCLVYLAVVALHCSRSGNFLWLKDTLLAIFYANIGPSDYAPGIGIIWFLPALFWCKSVYNVLYIVSEKFNFRDWQFSLLSGGLALCAIWLVGRDLLLPFNILAGVSLMLYYLLGMSFRRMEATGLWPGAHFNIGGHNMAIILLTGCWCGSVWFEKPLVVGACDYENILVQVLGSVGATLFVVWCMGWVLKHLSKIASFFRWCGEHSLSILCSNFLVTACGIVWLLPIAVSGTIAFVFNLLATLVFAYAWIKLRKSSVF